MEKLGKGGGSGREREGGGIGIIVKRNKMLSGVIKCVYDFNDK